MCRFKPLTLSQHIGTMMPPYKEEGIFNMIIRLCTPEDIPSVGNFYDGVVKHLDEHVNYPKWTYKVYPSEDSVKVMTEAGCQFLCLESDKIIGAFVLNDDPQGAYENAAWSKSLSKGDYMVCHALATAPSLQATGIGKRIVEFCIDYAKRHAYKALRLDVVPDNVPARKLYEKSGFTYVGDVDLQRGLADIPLFSMYELNL